MDAAATNSPNPAPNIFSLPPAILWGWLICGTLDLTSAFIDAKLTFDLGPVRLLQNVAGALLGPATYDGGLATAALGFAMHFSVALTWTTVFYFLSRRFPALLRWAVPSGLLYGAAIFFTMYGGVIPLTIELKSFYLTTFNRKWPDLRWSQFVIHLCCVGLPIALTARRFAPRAK